MVKTGDRRGMLAEVFAQANHAYGWMLIVELGKSGKRAIGATIVDKENLAGSLQSLCGRFQTLP